MGFLQTTVDESVNWLTNTFTNQRVAFPNGSNMGQCTAPIVWLFNHLGLPVPAMANHRADGWGTNFPAALASHWKHESFTPGRQYPRGTIMMWNSPHIAVVLHSDGSNVVQVFEQNADPDGSVCNSKSRVVTNNHRAATFVLIPIIDAPAPPPQSPAPVVTAPAPQTYENNVVDGITFSTLDGAPRQMFVARVGGIEKWNFKDVGNWRDFKSVEHLEYGTPVFIVGKAQHPIPPVGATYYMVDADFGDFKRTGIVRNQYGFNKVDLSENRPPALPVPAPAPVLQPEPTPEPTPVVIPEPAVPVRWQDAYRPFPAPVHYISTRNQYVDDLAGLQKSMMLPKYDSGSGSKAGMVAAYGTVNKDGIDYYRLKLDSDKNFDYWYCVPKIDPNTRTPNLLVFPGEVTNPVSRATVAKDAVVLAKSHIEFGVPKFLDDIIPKFLKNRK
jgi:hypothetical protein